MNPIITAIIIALIVVLVGLIVLYFLGRRIQTRQIEQQDMLEAARQTVSMLVIDKKRLRIKESGLPKIVAEQTPKYMRWAKVPIVKAKVGPKVMTLMADEKVFEQIPVKAEVKVAVSGIYITEIISARGGLAPITKKKGFMAKVRQKASEQIEADRKAQKSSKKK